MNEKKERIPCFDYARLFVAFLVVFGHLLPEDDAWPRVYIYSFHMPFFFFVSGMLHKITGKIEWRKYVRTLLIPFLFFNLFFYAIRPALDYLDVWKPFVKESDSTLGRMYIEYAEQMVSQMIHGHAINGVCWFIASLIWCRLLCDVIIKRQLIGFTIFLLVFCTATVLHHKFMFLGYSAMAFPIYMAGLLGRGMVLRILKEKCSVILGIVLLLFTVGLTLLNGRVTINGLMFSSNYDAPLSWVIFYVNALLGSVMILCLFSKFKEKKWVRTSSEALISILGFQMLFYYTLNSVFGTEPVIYALLNAIWITVICVALHGFVKRYAPFAVGK